MEYTHLGRTGLSVSRLCLGTMNFGPVTDVTDSHDIMDRAHELGINFFDTANVYGWDEDKGLTENIIGNWFARGGGRREKTVLATKLYGDMGEWPNDGKLSALNIRRACDASLKRLQTDYIDLYQMHHVDRDAPWDEIWEGFETLRAARQNHLRRLVELRRLAHREGARGGEPPQLPWPGRRAVAVQPRGPHGRTRGAARGARLRPRRHPVEPAAGRPARRHLAQGRPQPQQGRSRRRHARRRTGPPSKPTKAFCDELGEDPANVALAWLLHQPAVTAPIIGPRTLAQLDGAVRAIEIKLDDKALARLDEIWPGPGGEAPEAYAW